MSVVGVVGIVSGVGVVIVVIVVGVVGAVGVVRGGERTGVGLGLGVSWWRAGEGVRGRRMCWREVRRRWMCWAGMGKRRMGRSVLWGILQGYGDEVGA